jgi:hypothetical protein
MKRFLTVCVLAGVAAVLSVSSCGPKRDICPTKPPEFSCLDFDGGGLGGGGGTGTDLCDGQAPTFCNDGVTKVCRLEDCP